MVVCRVSLFSPSAASHSVGPAPRCHHGVTVSAGKMFIVGGEDGEGVFDDVWVFDLSTSSWQEIVPVNPHDFSGRQGCTCCVLDNKLFVIGGGDLLTNHIGAVLDLETLQWTDLRLHGVLGHKPDGRQHHASAVVSGCIVVHGGFDGIQHLGDSWLLDARSFTWRQLHKSDPAPASSNHALLLLDDSTLLRIGGEASSHATTVVAQPVVIDIRDEGSWASRSITGLPPQPVCDCSGGWLTGADGTKRLCLFGGWGEGAAACRCITVDPTSWSAADAAVKCAPHLEVSRLGAGGLQQAGDHVILFGGWDGMFQWMSSLLSIKLF